MRSSLVATSSIRSVNSNIVERSVFMCLATSISKLSPWWAATSSMSAYKSSNPPNFSTAWRTRLIPVVCRPIASSSAATAGPDASDSEENVKVTSAPGLVLRAPRLFMVSAASALAVAPIAAAGLFGSTSPSTAFSASTSRSVIDCWRRRMSSSSSRAFLVWAATRLQNIAAMSSRARIRALCSRQATSTIRLVRS